MKFKDYFLRETLNPDTAYDYQYDGDGEYVFYPDTEDKNTFYTVSLDRMPDWYLDISFSYTNKHKNIDQTIMPTGTGDAFKVFATISKIVMNYINPLRQTLKTISFSSEWSENSRINLYTRLSKKLQKELGDNWRLHIARSHGFIEFDLSKIHD